MDEISNEYGYSPFTIPEGEFKGVDEDTTILGTGAYILVPEDMPEDIAYSLTQTMYDHWDELREKDPFLKITPLHFRDTMIPFHSGAEKYLQEAGAIE